MNEEIRQRLEALRGSWARTADIQEKRAEKMRGNREVANGHYNYALALEACVEQLHQAMESASPERGSQACSQSVSSDWLGLLAEKVERRSKHWAASSADNGSPNGEIMWLVHYAFKELAEDIRACAESSPNVLMSGEPK